MDFLQELGSHRGGLVLLKTQLFWYGGRGWDGITGRICLLMDAAAGHRVPASAAATGAPTAATATTATTTALLLVDGQPHWVWVGADDLELLS